MCLVAREQGAFTRLSPPGAEMLATRHTPHSRPGTARDSAGRAGQSNVASPHLRSNRQPNRWPALPAESRRLSSLWRSRRSRAPKSAINRTNIVRADDGHNDTRHRSFPEFAVALCFAPATLRLYSPTGLSRYAITATPRVEGSLRRLLLLVGDHGRCRYRCR